jgi:dTDP-4-dehydrorhamnose reductase
MKLRVLVVGAGGFLGGRLLQSNDPRIEWIAAKRSDCDVTDRVSVQNAFEQSRPAVAVLTAALADIDRCEKEPALAHAINVGGAENVARECARFGARLLFTSSGAIFDGTAPRYLESDPPHPLSVYGSTKADAERVIREIVPGAIIARVSLALGFSPAGGTNALLDKLQSAFQNGKQVNAPTQEYRNAIDTETLTRWMLDLACNPQASGIFHLGASDAISRCEIVSRLAEAMGYPKTLVIPQNSEASDRAPRGRYHLLVPARIRDYSKTPVPTCAEAIERCIHVAA